MAKKSQDKSEVNLFLFVGDNRFKASAEARKIINQRLSPEEQTLSLEIIDGQASNAADAVDVIAQCRQAIATAGFLADKKLVWLQNASFFDNSPTGKSKSVKEAIDRLTSVISTTFPENHTLIITAKEVKGKTSFLKTCKQKGKVVEFALPKPWRRDKTAFEYAREVFAKKGISINSFLLKEFIGKTSTDLSHIQQESEKLTMFLGNRKQVRREDLQQIVCASHEKFSWDIEDALRNRDLARSINVLRQLLFQKHEPVALVTALAYHFRYLLLVREALDCGLLKPGTSRLPAQKQNLKNVPDHLQEFLIQALSADPRKRHPIAMRNAVTETRTYTRKKLVEAYDTILETRKKLVSTRVSPALLMEMLLIKLSLLPGTKE